MESRRIEEYYRPLNQLPAAGERDPRSNEYRLAWHVDGWSVAQLSVAAAMFDNITYREMPAALVVARAGLCCRYMGSRPQSCAEARRVIYSAAGCVGASRVAGCVPPSRANRLVLAPAPTCDPWCANPGHAVFVTPPPRPPPKPRGRPAGSKYRARAELLIRRGATAQQAAHTLGLRPARLAHILGAGKDKV
jgi:alkylhydroperoxidase family enzyme